MFWIDEWKENICCQSILYASQKSLPSECISPENIRLFLANLLYSKYFKLCIDICTEKKRECLGRLVAEVMRRNMFDQIMRLVHFADNSKIDNDRFYKVRSFLDHLNKVCLQNDVSEHCSIDEVMVTYYSKQNDKQFIKEIPIKLSYKLCASCLQEESFLHVEPSCGNQTRIPNRGFGHGPNIVLKKLFKWKIGATRTLRENSIQTHLCFHLF